MIDHDRSIWQRRYPTPARTDGAFTVKCAAVDAVPASPIRIAFCFEKGAPPEQLCAGLSEALAIVPVFAGRLIAGPRDRRIDCRGQGARLSHRSTEETLGSVLRSPIIREHAFIDPEPAFAGEGLLLAVDVTGFSCGGMLVVISWDHTVGDIASVGLLLRAWSLVGAGRPVVEMPRLILDRPAYLRRHLPLAPANDCELEIRPRTTRERGRPTAAAQSPSRVLVHLVCDGADLDELREQSRRQTGVRVSKNDALCAHIITTLAATEPSSRLRQLVLVVDVRRRSPIDETAIGNMVVVEAIDYPRSTPAAEFAAMIRHRVDALSSASGRLHRAEVFWAEHRHSATLDELAFRHVAPGSGVLSTTNWTGQGLHVFSPHGAEPCQVRLIGVTTPNALACIIERPRGAGLAVTLSLPPDAVERFVEASSVLHHRYTHASPDAGDDSIEPERA